MEQSHPKTSKRSWNKRRIILRALNYLAFSIISTQNVTFTCLNCYFSEEIEFLLECTETNHEGNIEYSAFLGRFLDPAKEIGFNLVSSNKKRFKNNCNIALNIETIQAVLLTNLSEHMPSDPRLAKFLESAGTVLNFFEAFLGRIEIKTAEKVERVYFEIDENNIEQWEKPQIRESKKAFFYATITGLSGYSRNPG